MPTADPCLSFTKAEADVETLLSQGKTSVGIEMASFYLTTSPGPICTPFKQKLATLIYQATLTDLLSMPTSDLGLAETLRWQEAERRADLFGVTDRASPLNLMAQAKNLGKLHWARALFLQAWTTGKLDHADLQSIDKYYVIMRDLGWNLVEKGPPADRMRGMMISQTADTISRAAKLGRGEADDDLRRWLGSDGGARPAPLTDDAVLASLAP